MEQHEQEVFDKIEEIYKSVDKNGSPKGKNFISHLVRSYLPIYKGSKVFDKPGKPMKCAITGNPLISVQEIWEGTRSDEFKQNFLESLKIQFSESNNKEIKHPLADILKGRVIGYKGENTDTFLSTLAYEQLINWVQTKILMGDKHIGWIVRDMQNKQMVKNVKKTLTKPEDKPIVNRFEQIVKNPKKATFGDLDVLKELKQKMESKNK